MKLVQYYNISTYIQYLANDYYYFHVYLLSILSLLLVVVNYVLNNKILIMISTIFYACSLDGRPGVDINNLIEKCSPVKIKLYSQNQPDLLASTGRTLDEIPLDSLFEGNIIIDQLIFIQKKQLSFRPKLGPLVLKMTDYCLLIKLATPINDSKICSICYKKNNKMIKTKCQHVFCQQCIDIWHHKCQVNNRYTTCPMCRKI